jgi:hypothetical protein
MRLTNNCKLAATDWGIMVKVWCVLIILTASNLVSAQRKEQLWLDYQIDYPFANRFLFEAAGSYQTLLSSEDKWWSLGLTTTFEAWCLTFLM